jgi:hypothetical protein
VSENKLPSRSTLSNAIHEKLRVNPRRPFRKTKYVLATESERVPRGKGEKFRCERSEIVPETIRLQGVRAEKRLRAFCIMSLRVSFSSKPQSSLKLRQSESKSEQGDKLLELYPKRW